MFPWILMLMGEPEEMKMSDAFFSAISCRSFSMNMGDAPFFGVLPLPWERAGERVSRPAAIR